MDSVNSVWETVESALQTNWSDVQLSLQQTMHSLHDKLTQHNSLPPLIPDSWSSYALTQPPTPPPPPPSPAAARVVLAKLAQHPYLVAFVTAASVSATTHYLYPRLFHDRVLPALQPFLPLVLLPTTTRPLRVTRAPGDEIRKEAVLVLGAEPGGLGELLALDLEKRGFVVVATVRDAKDVDALEKKSRGWIKVLVLDPTESSSVGPFLRSLATSLSLRYPLHTSGDPFARPALSLSLVSLINLLPLHSNTRDLRPIEALEPEQIRRVVSEPIATFIGALRGILPILRTDAGRPGAHEAIVLTVVPSTTANVALPFLALDAAVSQSIVALANSLRRELAAARSTRIRSTILEVGFFDLPSTEGSLPVAPNSPAVRSMNLDASNSNTAPDQAISPMSTRVSSIYTPALLRRQHIRAGSAVGASGRRKGRNPKDFTKKVFEILVYGRGGTTARVGSGALTYRLISLLPTFLTDTFLALQDKLVSFILLHYQFRFLPALPSSPPHNTSSATRPLPHPPFLQPGQQGATQSSSSASSAANVEELSFSTESQATAKGGNGSSANSSEKGDDEPERDEFGSFVQV